MIFLGTHVLLYLWLNCTIDQGIDHTHNKRSGHYAQELLYFKGFSKIKLDAYLEEELYDLITYCIQNSTASDYSSKEDRIKEIGQELFLDGGVDALENMYFSIEHRVRDEISKDAKPYRPLWNGITGEWNY